MNTNKKNPVTITEDDYQQLKQYVVDNPTQDMSLSAELKRAVIVPKEALPKHTVRINSKVTVVELRNEKIMEFSIVMPAHADINSNKISILTPMGAALIGFRKGDEVEWQVPGGLKRFRILDVVNKE